MSGLSNGKAVEAIVALKYWMRATDYQPHAEEKAVLLACEQKANDLWRAGMGVGGFGGLGVASAAKLPLVPKLAVTTAFASAGGFYGNVRACTLRLSVLVNASLSDACFA